MNVWLLQGTSGLHAPQQDLLLSKQPQGLDPSELVAVTTLHLPELPHCKSASAV